MAVRGGIRGTGRLRGHRRRPYATFDHPDVVPLRDLSGWLPQLWLAELFHGPTLAFKDVALQLVGRLFDHELARRGSKVTIVGATSGDTGSAAIAACRDREAIEIVILHPAGRVSEVQYATTTAAIGLPVDWLRWAQYPDAAGIAGPAGHPLRGTGFRYAKGRRGGNSDRPGHGTTEPHRLFVRGRAGRIRGDSHRSCGSCGAVAPLSQGPAERYRRPAVVLGRLDAQKLRSAAVPTALAAMPAAPSADRRSRRNHLHHRQHWPAQGRAFHPRQFRRPSGADRRLLRHPAGRGRCALLSAVRPVQLCDGRNGGDSRHGPFAAGPGRSGEDHRGRPRLERDAGVWFAGGLAPRGPILRGRGDGCRPCAACFRPGGRFPPRCLAA